MQVEFIGLERVDFVNDNNQRVTGITAWYLDQEEYSRDVAGQIPRKKFFSQAEVQKFGIDSPGLYDITVNLSGKVSDVIKIK